MPYQRKRKEIITDKCRVKKKRLALVWFVMLVLVFVVFLVVIGSVVLPKLSSIQWAKQEQLAWENAKYSNERPYAAVTNGTNVTSTLWYVPHGEACSEANATTVCGPNSVCCPESSWQLLNVTHVKTPSTCQLNKNSVNNQHVLKYSRWRYNKSQCLAQGQSVTHVFEQQKQNGKNIFYSATNS